MFFQVHQNAILEEILSRNGTLPEQKKLCAPTKMLLPTNKIPNILFQHNGLFRKNSPATAEVCTPFRKLTSSKSECTRNSTFQHLYDITKAITRNEAPENAVLWPIVLKR